MKQTAISFAFCLVALTSWCLEGNYSAHDPSRLVRDGARYWVFTTGRGVASRWSVDRVTWQAGPAVFSALPAWASQAVPGNNGDAWAPDVLYFNGRWNLYYSVSTFGQNDSVIGLVTNPTLDPASPSYQWTDQGLVIETNPGDNFNAIDPAVTRDAAGNLWMTFGSFWSGIKLIPLDANGKRLGTAMYSLASRPNTAIEAAYIHYRDGSYYLFVNLDQCCAGTNSTYRIRVG